MISTARIVSSQREVALAMNLSERQVREYFASGMPGNPGSYDLEACKEWRRKNIRTKDPKATADNRSARERKLEADAVLAESRAEQIQLNLAKERGELWHRADVLQSVSTILSWVKCQLEAIPDAVEMQLPPEVRPDVKHSIENHIRGTLARMSTAQLVEDMNGNYTVVDDNSSTSPQAVSTGGSEDAGSGGKLAPDGSDESGNDSQGRVR